MPTSLLINVRHSVLCFDLFRTLIIQTFAFNFCNDCGAGIFFFNPLKVTFDISSFLKKHFIGFILDKLSIFVLYQFKIIY